jgi:undecaprenyl-diphosphatase
MTYFQALFLALIQGVTELFPVSSLGHAVIVPALLDWQVNLHDVGFLPFLVMLHLGTGTALLLYFRRDWLEMAEGVLGRGAAVNQHRRLFTLLVIGTIPAILIGGLLEGLFRYLFGSPSCASIFLILNGVMLFYGEKKIKPPAIPKTLEQLTVKEALLIGACQCAALFPGISRSGITILAGLGIGLDAKAAARFSFLLATPIIIGAGVLEVPKLLHANGSGPTGMLGMALIAGLVAGVTAYLATAFLMRYFAKNRDTHEVTALAPFGRYCLIAGTLALLWALFT